MESGQATGNLGGLDQSHSVQDVGLHEANSAPLLRRQLLKPVAVLAINRDDAAALQLTGDREVWTVNAIRNSPQPGEFVPFPAVPPSVRDFMNENLADVAQMHVVLDAAESALLPYRVESSKTFMPKPRTGFRTA